MKCFSKIKVLVEFFLFFFIFFLFFISIGFNCNQLKLYGLKYNWPKNNYWTHILSSLTSNKLCIKLSKAL